MLQNSSLGCRFKWSLVLECLSGVPLGSTVIESGEKKQGRAEGKSSWITVQMTLADPTGSGVKIVLQGCPEKSTGQAFVLPPGWVVA